MPQTGDGPFKSGERLTAAKLNDATGGRPLNASGSARINRDSGGEVIQVDDAEIIFIKLTDKDTTKTPIRYGWKEVVRKTDAAGNTVWLDTSRTALKTTDYAIELNNQNLSTSDGYVYRAERSPHSGEWLFFLRRKAQDCLITFLNSSPTNPAYWQTKSYGSLNAMRSVLSYQTFTGAIPHSVLLDYDFYQKKFRVLDVGASTFNSVQVNGSYVSEWGYSAPSGGFTPGSWQSEGWTGNIFNGNLTTYAWEVWTWAKPDVLDITSLTSTCTVSPVIPGTSAPLNPHKVVKATFISNSSIGSPPSRINDFNIQAAEQFSTPLPITNAKDEYFYITRLSQTSCQGSQSWLGSYWNTTPSYAQVYYDSYGNFFVPAYSYNYRRDFVISSAAVVKTSLTGVQYKVTVSYRHQVTGDNIRSSPIYGTYTFSSDYSAVLPYTVGAKVQIPLTTTYPSIDSRRIQYIDLGTIELEVVEI